MSSSEPIYIWLIAKGYSAKFLHNKKNRHKISILCQYFDIDYGKLSVTNDLAKEMVKIINARLNKGEELDRESCITSFLTAIEPKLKWDLDHIAFCRSKKFYQSKRWLNLRIKALEKSNKCQACGASPEDGAVLHVDHVLPRSIFPEYALNINNLQILCRDCNIGKGVDLIKRF